MASSKPPTYEKHSYNSLQEMVRAIAKRVLSEEHGRGLTVLLVDRTIKTRFATEFRTNAFDAARRISFDKDTWNAPSEKFIVKIGGQIQAEKDARRLKTHITPIGDDARLNPTKILQLVKNANDITIIFDDAHLIYEKDLDLWNNLVCNTGSQMRLVLIIPVNSENDKEKCWKQLPEKRRLWVSQDPKAKARFMVKSIKPEDTARQ